jgi:hypothetical protein
MRKLYLSLLLGFLVSISLLTASCNGTSHPSSTQTTLKTTTTATATTSGGNIFSLGQNISTMKYTMITTMPGYAPISTITSVKKGKMRMEMNVGGYLSITLIDDSTKTMYSYMPEQNTAMQMNFSQAQQSAVSQAGSIEGYNPKAAGSETIDGIVCQIYEYSMSGNAVKMWLWKDKGLPVKMVMTSADGTTTIEYKNYDFSDIPDNMFVLPAGVNIIQASGG